MRFHKLEMSGFKSFVDKTTVTFQGGMTAVVGPNGCGKSNISDAIRWVLGEKSAKNLRGDKMEDVIFNGSELRKPLGMAEVNLTLQDVDGTGIGFTEFKEITITRRLYRSGDSEYLINKIPCRLKDIRDLLIDTGISSKAYAIIEQGKIGQLIVSKPEERRYIIEEVAGITKYKSRKVEALSKLMETEDNLSRVNDIVFEVKRQMASLDRQARKAERYKNLSAELRSLELKMAHDDFLGLSENSAEAETAYTRLTEEESAARNAVSAREADLSEARIRLAEREHELMDHQREVHRLESEVSRLEARVEVAASQLKDLDEREGRMRGERGQLELERIELDSQASSLKEEHRSLRDELERLREELRGLEAAFQSRADSAHGLERGIEEERARIFNIQAEISHGNNSLSRLEERRAGLEARAKRAKEEEDETDARHGVLKVEADKKKMELDAVNSALAEVEKERSTAQDSIARTRELLKELERELAAGREAHAKKSSRLQSLKELEENLEGYGEGVRALMSEKKHGAVSGVRLLVADALQTAPEYEKAVEAVLGERLENVVVDDHDSARAAIEYLRGKNFGRGTFIPLTPRDTDKAAGHSGDGVVGPALGLVTPNSGYENVVGALLGGVLIVRDLDTALGLWKDGTACTLVTLSGEVLDPSGALSGGGASSGGGFLSKKREIRELVVEVEQLTESIQTAADRLAESGYQLERLESSLKGLNESVNDKKLAALGIEKDYNAAASELERVVKKMDVLGIEAEQRAQEELEIREGIASLHSGIEGLQAEKTKKEASIAGHQDELKSVREELEKEREALTVRKMEMSALIEKHESSARDIKRADLQTMELQRKLSRLDAESAEVATRRAELNAGRYEAEAGIGTLMKSVIGMKEKVPALQSMYEEVNASITALEETVKTTRKEADAIRDSVAELELRRAELKIKIEYLEETVRHNYHIGVGEIDDETKAREIDRENAEMDASELRIKLEKLGPVNVGAIEEYEELSERFNFLTSQKTDLESSVARLREAIGKINKTSEELFMEAFNAINETFKKLFVTLFNGGQGELQLTPHESGDLLDSGLEIVAQPPGKKLQSLLLCSGGEKAMIAAALTFACFLVKPSPFCVLDEVDAPLDESNVQRFGKMLLEFADRTQFIVITHSRPTMELADALYGVTMDEPGVSRMVSVKLKEDPQPAEV